MSSPREAPRWLAAAAVVGTVLAALAANEALRRFGAIAAPPPASDLDPVHLTSLSRSDRFELVLVAALAAARFALLAVRRRRLLEPLLDLPLLGVVLAVSGGSLSPLDPTLPIVYVAAILFLRGAESGRTAPRRLAVEILLGLVALHAVVQRHDRRRLDDGEARVETELSSQVETTRRDHRRALGDVDAVLAGVPDGEALAAKLAAADADRALRAPFETMKARLRESQAAFRAFLDALEPRMESESVAEAKLALTRALDRAYDDYFTAREQWRAGAPPPSADRDVASLDLARETQWAERQELLDRVDRFEDAIGARDRLRARADAFLRSSLLRRAAVSFALLLFAAFAVALRDRLTERVAALEERRAQREIELAESEKEHWIALTAGLTHGLGNDVVAYDVYLRELDELLARSGVTAPPRAREIVRFVADSNRGRLGFLRFLDAFARQRQAAAGDAPPIAFEPLALPPLLERVRRNVAQVEIADLPPEGSDPAADRQIRRLRDLPLEVRVASPDAATLRRGQRGIVEFFVYEMVKNALRSCTGERPLVATLSRADGRLRLALVNDVEVEASHGVCPRCGREADLRRVRRRRDAPPACERCFAAALQELLEASFAPGKGSGTGLGLFLIRYFLQALWNGEIRARVEEAAIPTVSFTLELQDAA